MSCHMTNTSPGVHLVNGRQLAGQFDLFRLRRRGFVFFCPLCQGVLPQILMLHITCNIYYVHFYKLKITFIEVPFDILKTNFEKWKFTWAKNAGNSRNVCVNVTLPLTSFKWTRSIFWVYLVFAKSKIALTNNLMQGIQSIFSFEQKRFLRYFGGENKIFILSKILQKIRLKNSVWQIRPRFL